MKPFIEVAARHIAARLVPRGNLDLPRRFYAIMHLCPFETVATEKLSPLCSSFSEEYFEIYGYAGYAPHLPIVYTPLTLCFR